MPRVTFQPDGLSIECAEGTNLFELARKHGVAVETSCVGKGTCGLCRVKVLAGQEHLSPYTPDEKKHLGNVYFLTKVRLSCRVTVQGGDVTVEVKRR